MLGRAEVLAVPAKCHHSNRRAAAHFRCACFPLLPAQPSQAPGPCPACFRARARSAALPCSRIVRAEIWPAQLAKRANSPPPFLEHLRDAAREGASPSRMPIRRRAIQKWTHWGLNPGPSACEADVIPLHHEPNGYCLGVECSFLFCVCLFGGWW